MRDFTLSDLEKIVAERAKASPEESYTAKLISRGMDVAAKKLGEEAVEAVIAAVNQNHANLVAESADVLYHLLVVLKAANIPLNDVLDELNKRTSQTGLQEKASRPKS
jgi:phosphoribosyl-ATP pyrophosphohydrolase